MDSIVKTRLHMRQFLTPETFFFPSVIFGQEAKLELLSRGFMFDMQRLCKFSEFLLI